MGSHRVGHDRNDLAAAAAAGGGMTVPVRGWRRRDQARVSLGVAWVGGPGGGGACRSSAGRGQCLSGSELEVPEEKWTRW